MFPRLVGSWSGGEVNPLYIVVEGKKTFTITPNMAITTAIALLIGTYYIFNIEYPAAGRSTYTFLEAVLLGKDKEARKRVTIQKLLSDLAH